MKNNASLNITWQRLVSDGNTCSRCGLTGENLEEAVKQLKELGIEVVLEKIKLSPEEFKKDPIKSNYILLNGRSLEDVIGAKTRKSQCFGVCGNTKCRAMKTEKGTLEVIPASLIVKAGLAVLGKS